MSIEARAQWDYSDQDDADPCPECGREVYADEIWPAFECERRHGGCGWSAWRSDSCLAKAEARIKELEDGIRQHQKANARWGYRTMAPDRALWSLLNEGSE